MKSIGKIIEEFIGQHPSLDGGMPLSVVEAFNLYRQLSDTLTAAGATDEQRAEVCARCADSLMRDSSLTEEQRDAAIGAMQDAFGFDLKVSTRGDHLTANWQITKRELH